MWEWWTFQREAPRSELPEYDFRLHLYKSRSSFCHMDDFLFQAFIYPAFTFADFHILPSEPASRRWRNCWRSWSSWCSAAVGFLQTVRLSLYCNWCSGACKLISRGMITDILPALQLFLGATARGPSGGPFLFEPSSRSPWFRFRDSVADLKPCEPASGFNLSNDNAELVTHELTQVTSFPTDSPGRTAPKFASTQTRSGSRTCWGKLPHEGGKKQNLMSIIGCMIVEVNVTLFVFYWYLSVTLSLKRKPLDLTYFWIIIF